jgi:hypothetical protein
MGGIASVRMPVLLRPDRFDKRLDGSAARKCRCRP